MNIFNEMIAMKGVFCSFIEFETNLIEKTTFAPPDVYSAAVKTFSTLFIILAVILTIYWLIKRFRPKGSGLMAGERWIKVITATYIAPKKMVVLVEVAGEILVLGLTDDHITMLTTVNNEQTVHHLKTSQEKKTTISPFYQQFRSLITKYGGEREKDESLVHKFMSDSRENNETIKKIDVSGIKT